MTIGDLIAAGWVPQYFDGETVPYRLHFRQHVLRFLRSGDLCVVERYRYGTIQDRESDTTGSYDAALAKLCARQHWTGVTLGEFLRGLNGPPQPE